MLVHAHDAVLDVPVRGEELLEVWRVDAALEAADEDLALVRVRVYGGLGGEGGGGETQPM